jgi:mono/diheme cytochrome c family protein
MSAMKQVLVAAIATLSWAMPAFAPLAFAQGATAGDPAHGKQLFMADACYTCHGTTAGGGGPAGPALAHQNLPPEAIMQQLRHPQTRMPAYTDKVLPDKDAADIIAYIQSLSQGPKANAKDIPVLNQ